MICFNWPGFVVGMAFDDIVYEVAAAEDIIDLGEVACVVGL